ncbi:MAG TPA: nucleotidyltransferase family protein [Bryobacteraceae bacterium]|nr:nucleotidyltransferase family protein [Bryobacteraceae bacterium]
MIDPATIRQSLSGEVRLLACCARTSLDAANGAERDRILAEGPDWSELLLLAESHKLAPLLHWHTRDSAAVPREVREELQERFNENARRNLWMTSELMRIVGRLKNAGIECLPFKGLGIAAAVYGNISLRSFLDLDILIRPEDFAAAVPALCDAGYEPEYQVAAGAARESFLEAEHALSLVHRDSELTLELHWRFTERVCAVPFRMERVWARSSPSAWARGAFRELAAEDLFLYLAVHGAKHCWHRLEWVCAVAELVRRNPSMNWEHVFCEARELGVARAAAAALWLPHILLGAEVPARARREMPRYGSLAGVLKKIVELMFEPGVEWGAAHVAVQLALRDRLRDRCRMILWTMVRDPQPKDRAALPLPARFGVLLRALRPLRLILTQGWQLSRQCLALSRPRSSSARRDSIRNREVEA